MKQKGKGIPVGKDRITQWESAGCARGPGSGPAIREQRELRLKGREENLHPVEAPGGVWEPWQGGGEERRRAVLLKGVWRAWSLA